MNASRKPKRSPRSRGGVSTRAAIDSLIVDDDALFRRGLREHLESSGIGVVGEAADTTGALALAAEKEPDVILLAMRMPGDSVIDAVRQLRLEAPSAQLLLMADSPDDEEIVEAIMAGASGSLSKGSDGDEILAAVTAAASGENALSPEIISALIERAREHAPPPTGNEHPDLTDREREVLGLIVEGKDNNEIAAALVISPETVKSHVSTVLAKLGAGNRAEAGVKAVRAGLV